jgi:hypothetical protein
VHTCGRVGACRRLDSTSIDPMLVPSHQDTHTLTLD